MGDPWDEPQPVQVDTAAPARDPWEGPADRPAPETLPPASRLDPWEQPEEAASKPAPAWHWWEPGTAAPELGPGMSLDWATPAATPEILAARNAAFRKQFDLNTGHTPDLWRNATEPILKVAHALTPQELAEAWDAAKIILSQKEGETWQDIEARLAASPTAKPNATQKALAGIQQPVAGAVNFFTSPVGVATLGTGALPALAQKAISAIFVTQMLTSLPEDVQTLSEGWFDKDPEKISRGLAGLGLNATFIAQGIKHGMAEGKAEIRNQKSEILQPPASAPSEFGGLKSEIINPKSEIAYAPQESQNEPGLQIQRLGTGPQRPPDQPGPGNRLPDKGGEAPPQALTLTELKYLAEDIRARQPVSAALAARAGIQLPEGYKLEGDRWLYTEPPRPETEAARMAREQSEAMAALRASKAAEPIADPWEEPAKATPEREVADTWEPPESPAPHDLGDRPPDLIDWIEQNFPNGVRVPSTADFDELFAKTRAVQASASAPRYSVAKDILRRTSGEPADQVLKELHDQGMYRRLESPEDLLNTIHAAAEARIGWAEQSRAARDHIDEWLTRAIDATALDRSEPFEGISGAPVWLTKSAAHGVLSAMRMTYRASRKLGLAIEDGLAWLRSQNLPGFNERQARLWLLQLEAREWMQNLRAAGGMRPLDKSSPEAQAAPDEAQARGEIQGRQPANDLAKRRLVAERERPGSLPKPGTPEHERELQQAAARAYAAGEALRALIDQLPRRPSGQLDWRAMGSNRADRVFKLENQRLDAIDDYQQAANRTGIVYPPHQGPPPDNTSRFTPRQPYPNPSLERYSEFPPREWDPVRGVYKTGNVELWADKTIAEGRKRFHANLDPELLAAYAVKGAIILARGAHDFASWSAAMLSEFGETIRPHLSALWNQIRQRAFTIQSSPDISDQVKAGTASDLLYTPRSFEQLNQEAAAIIQQHGPDAALNIFVDPRSGLPGDTRAALGASLERHYRAAETVARTSTPPDLAAANAAADQQIKLWRADAYGTDVAQSLSARRLYDGASSTAKLRQAQDVFDQSAGTSFEEIRPQVDAVAGAIQQGHADAVEQIRIDPATNDAARAAVDDAVANSPETHRAVIMELAQPFASSPAILANARVAVRAKADELLNRAPRPPGLTAPQALRRILDELAERAATIAGNHYQGAEPGVTLRDKLQQRLGLDQAAATRLAASLDNGFAAMVKAATAKLSQRVATERARQTGALTADATDFAVDRAIRQQLRQHNLQLGELLAKATAETVPATQKSIGQRIVEASGLTGEAARKLQETFDRRWTALSDAAKRSRLEALQKQAGRPPLPPKLRSAAEDLIKLTRLGALDDTAFHDLVKKRMNLREITPEIARELVRRANDIDKQPPGFLRDRASTQLLNWVYRQAGTRLADVPMGMFYNNVLSGLTTAAKIPFENMNLLVGQTIISLLRGRLGPAATLQAFGRGLKKGGLQGAEILKTGIVTGAREGQHPSGVMELKPFGEKGDIINYWKWFGREISALHVSTFKPAWEIKQSMVAYQLARTEGLRGQAAQARATELLANTPERIDAARAQAAGELARLGNTSKLDYRRRVLEILEQQRESNMPGSTALARDFALRTTYLGKPYGFLGYIAEAVHSGIEGARAQFPVLGRGLKSQIPFTTVVANILNEKLNWTPVGAFRAAAALRSGELYGRPMMERGEVGDLLAKSVLGTILLGTLGTLAGQYIHGSGPSSPSQRKQLQATGWVPNSIGPLDGRYYSWVNTPAAAGLAWIGNWQDWHRYGKGDAADAESRAVYALRGSADVIVSQGMLDGLKRVLESFGNANKAEGGAAIERSLARTAGAFVAPNLLMQIDKIFDPSVYDSTGIVAALKSQVPFYRRDNKPALNALGEPLEQGPFGQWTKAQTQDRLWLAIAARQAWIPEVPKDVIVGSKSEGPGNFRIMSPDERYNYVRACAADLRVELDPVTILSSDPTEAPHYVHSVVEEVRARHKPSF